MSATMRSASPVACGKGFAESDNDDSAEGITTF